MTAVTNTHARARHFLCLPLVILELFRYFDVKHLTPSATIQELVSPSLSGRTNVSFSSRFITNVKLP